MTHSPEKRARYDERYSVWSGSPKGVRPNFEKCAESVTGKNAWIPHQCRNGCGHGPEGAYCKTHAKRYK